MFLFIYFSTRNCSSFISPTRKKGWSTDTLITPATATLNRHPTVLNSVQKQECGISLGFLTVLCSTVGYIGDIGRSL